MVYSIYHIHISFDDFDVYINHVIHGGPPHPALKLEEASGHRLAMSFRASVGPSTNSGFI